jgi:hypothetical protein
MSKDKDLIERMNKKMLGVDTGRYSESEVKDMNKNVSYKNFKNENLMYISTDTSDCRDYTATYTYKFSPRDRDDFRLLYAKVNEVRLRMEKVMSSNDDVDYEYELIKYKEWLESIVK